MFSKSPSPLLSSQAYARILGSRRLRRLLLPEGLTSSPYEILEYSAVLTLHDGAGLWATFARTERVRFLQDGVGGILDHFWGDGVVLAFYHNSAGGIEDSIRDGGRHHLVIGLPRRMKRGEVFTFRVSRTAMVAFTEREEWVQMIIDHPVRKLSRTVIFPAERPCREARVDLAGSELPLRVVRLSDGRTVLGIDLWQPRVETPYGITWSW